VFAAVIGPQLVIFTKDMLSPHLFAASFLGQSACALLAAIVLNFVKIPRLTSKPTEPPRPLLHITLTPQFIVAVACGIVSYGMMNMVMTSAPLAMIDCGHSVTDSALGIQWHVIAMYGPSFFTGHLINRFGVERIIAVGLGALLLAAGVGISGITVAHFWTDLILLGLGWNFAFIGATSIVASCYRPEEKGKAQGFHDFVLFSTVAFASLMSGAVYNAWGWEMLAMIVLPVAGICLLLLAAQRLATRRRIA
jgi:cyanate permease